jgi:hypothetical protein
MYKLKQIFIEKEGAWDKANLLSEGVKTVVLKTGRV